MASRYGCTNAHAVALRGCVLHRISRISRRGGVAEARGPGITCGVSTRHGFIGLSRRPQTSRRLCYDYDSFVFFAWPVVVPVYLFQTRGARAFLTLLCFAGICVIAVLASSVVIIVREFVLS